MDDLDKKRVGQKDQKDRKDREYINSEEFYDDAYDLAGANGRVEETGLDPDEEAGRTVSPSNIEDTSEPSSLAEAEMELQYLKKAFNNLKEEYGELNNKYLKSLAESENFRKRMHREKEEFLKYANEGIIKDLLPALDFLDLALCHSVSYVETDTSGSLKAFVDGIKMAYEEFLKVLEKHGLQIINTENKRFDANFHEVVQIVEDTDQPEGKIIEEKRKGYAFKNRLIRPSSVCIAKPGSGSDSGNSGDSE